MPRFEVGSDPTAFESEANRIRRGLREFNASIIGEDFQPVRVVARDEAGELIGGLVGGTYWGWLHVETLWVSEPHRRHGLGTRLLEMAEAEALHRGCQHAFLDTFSFQARPLYERLGYRVVGIVPGFPAGHERYFMVKRRSPLDGAWERRAAGGTDVQDEVGRLLSRRNGHFALESGHHGELWLDLELLFLHPARVRPLADALASRLARYGIEAVCGPLIEGAFVGLAVASALELPFAYSERVPDPAARGLFPFGYRIPAALRSQLAGRRVAVIDDVVNAGSAVRGTLLDLEACGAVPVVVGTLAILGRSADALFAERGVALEALASFPNEIWEPTACPLCARGVPLSG